MKKFIYILVCASIILSCAVTTVSAQQSHLIDAPHIKQNPGWPTGCEIVTATMAVQYIGLNASVADLVAHMPTGPYPYIVPNVERKGANPWKVFPGDPKGTGYGAFSPVIEKTLNSYLSASGSNYKAIRLMGYTIEQLCTDYIDKDIPIIFYATNQTSDSAKEQLKPSYPGTSWTDYETGEYFTWCAMEHCLLLVGYDENYYYFNDPGRSAKSVKYTRASVEASYRSVLSQAVAIVPKDGNFGKPPVPVKGYSISGDVDNDGKLSTYDLWIVRSTVRGSLTLDTHQFTIADIDKNGKISSMDYLIMKRMLNGTAPNKY